MDFKENQFILHELYFLNYLSDGNLCNACEVSVRLRSLVFSGLDVDTKMQLLLFVRKFSVFFFNKRNEAKGAQPEPHPFLYSSGLKAIKSLSPQEHQLLPPRKHILP